MARVEGGAVIIDTNWPGLKNQIDIRNVNFKYEEDSTAYSIFAIDGQYFYQTVIYKSGQAPQDQATYDTWRAEFEADYKNRTTDFNSTQPFYLSNVDGYSVVLKDGATPTVNDGYGIAIVGSDGSNYRLLKTDSSGRPVLVGAGIAGTPAGGVITIQGATGGEPIPVSGNITASSASTSDNDLAIPLFSTLVGGTDGTNLRPLRVFDVDSGGGQQWVLGVGLRKSSGGGSVEAGTSSDPIRIDPTGTTTQPVSGTVTANQGGAWTVAATQSGTWTVQPGNTANTTPWLITINEGGNTATVSAAGALKIDGSAVTQPVSGTVTANAGTGNFTVVQATAANLRAQTASESSTGSAIPALAAMVGGSDGTNLRALFVDTSGRLIVIGGAANGAAVAGNPVLIAGSDGTNARSIRTATDGTIRIDPTGITTQPISGTVTADAGTGTFTVAGTVAATQSGTWNITNISGTISLPIGAATETTLAAMSAKLPAALVGGRLDTNIGAWLGSTAPTVGQKTMANSIPIAISSDQTVIPVSQSGTWTVQQGTPPWSVVGAAADGAAVTGNPILMGGQDGTNVQSILTDTLGRIVTASAASAATNGFSNGEIILASTTVTAVRATTYTEPTSGAQRSMASSSAADTSAGTGARTVRITYYTLSAGTVAGPFTEIITLNGTGNVNTVATNICYIEKLEVITVGSGGVNAGTITLFGATAGGGGTVWTIAVGANRTFSAHHYVPSSKTCSITTFNGGIKGADTSGFILRAKDPTNANSAELQINDLLRAPSSGNTPVRPYTAPLKVTGPSRITAFAVPDSSSSRTYYASFDFYEE